jgi:hypothetical protein
MKKDERRHRLSLQGGRITTLRCRSLPWPPQNYGRPEQAHYRSYRVPTVGARPFDDKKPDE